MMHMIQNHHTSAVLLIHFCEVSGMCFIYYLTCCENLYAMCSLSSVLFQYRYLDDRIVYSHAHKLANNLFNCLTLMHLYFDIILITMSLIGILDYYINYIVTDKHLHDLSND